MRHIFFIPVSICLILSNWNIQAQQTRPIKAPDLIKEHLDTLDPLPKLGGRIFYDNRLSNPGANLAANCSTCHTPPFLSRGNQLYSDRIPLSVTPANSRGGKLTTVRNAPTLQDASTLTTFNADGAHTDLHEFLRSKITSLHMGWEADQAPDVYNEIHALFLNDQGEDLFADGSYLEQFKTATGLDLLETKQEDLINKTLELLAAYLNTITSNRTSAYDALTFLNRFNEGLVGSADSPQALSGRLFGRFANQEGRASIKFPNSYSEESYQGYKTFIRTETTFSVSTGRLENNIGNCIACHVPPNFTDGKFHNTGTVQLQYDQTHGDGKFSKLDPTTTTFAKVTKDDPTKVDLGRYTVEHTDQSIGQFRTPGLRNITKTAPYNQNGQSKTLEDVIRKKIEISELAKAGKLRNPDPAYLTMNLTEKDIPEVVAFLRTLDEVPKDQYRDFRIKNVRTRQESIEQSN